MKNYEVTFIVDPVLSGDEIEATAQTYVNYLEKVGCHIVHVDKMGLRPLAYEIKRRSSGVYFCVEFSSSNGDYMDEFELALRRDERLLRFLTVALDKFGVKYNEDKRKGLINKKKKAGAESRSASVAAPAVVEAPAAPAAPVEPEVKAEEFAAAAKAEEAVAETPEVAAEEAAPAADAAEA